MELNIRIEHVTAGTAELHGPWATPVVITRGSAYRIGRIPENELVLEGPTVSRRHATIVWAPEAERPTIEDLASANGTLVDGAAVEAGRPRPLRDGAVIDIGEHRLGVGRPSPGERMAPPPSGRTPTPTTTRTSSRTTRRPKAAPAPHSRPEGVGYVSFSDKGRGSG